MYRTIIFFFAYYCISSVVLVTNSATLSLGSRERKVQIITSSSFENKPLALINVYPYSSDWYSSYKIRNSSSVIELSAKEIIYKRVSHLTSPSSVLLSQS